MALDLGELVARLGLDEDKFEEGLEGAKGMWDGFGSMLKTSAVAMGAGAGVALAAGLASAMDADAATDKLAAQLGLSAAESKRLGGVAGSLYAHAYGENLEEVNTAVGAVVSSIAGMRTASNKDIQSMAAKALDMAKVFEIDVTRSTQVVGQLIKSGFAKDGVQAMDLLVAAMQRVPAAVREDLVDALDEYSPFMTSLGLKGADAMNLLVQSTAKGAFGLDKTGDALKEFTLLSTDMSKNSKAGYDAIGLSQTKMTADILKGGTSAKDAFSKIVTGLQGIKDPTKQSQAALALFGTPLEDLSVTEIPKFLQSLTAAKGGMGDVGGAADKMGKTLHDNASTKIETFKRGITTAFTNVVGGVALPMIDKLVTTLNSNLGPTLSKVSSVFTDTVVPAVKSVSKWIGENKTVIEVVGGIIAAVFVPHWVALGIAATVSGAKQVAAWVVTQGAAIKAAAVHSGQVVLMVAKWLGMGVAAIANAAKVAAAWLVTQAGAARAAIVQGVQIGLMVGGWVLMGAQSLLQAARVAAAWVIAMGPLGWAIAAVVAAVALIIANWDKVKNFVTKTLPAALKTGFDFIVNLIKKAAQLGFLGPVGLIITHWGKIKTFFTVTVPNWLKSFGQAAIRFIKSAAEKGFLGPVPLIIARWGQIKTFFLVTLPSIFKRGIDAAVTFVSSLPGRIQKFFASQVNMLKSAGVDAIRGLWSGLSSMGGWIKDKVMILIREILPYPVRRALGIKSPSTVFAEIGRNVIKGLVVGLTSSEKDKVKEAGAKLVALIKSSFAKTAAYTTIDDKLIKLVGSTNTQLQKLADRRAALAAKLQQALDYAAGISDKAKSFAASLSIKFADEEGNEVDPSASGLIAGMNNRLDALRRFGADVTKLVGMGLSKTITDEWLQAGPEQAAAMAAAVAAGGAGAVTELNAVQGRIDTEAQKLGELGADYLYDAGAQAGNGFLTGLTGQLDQLETQMEILAQKLVDAVKKGIAEASANVFGASEKPLPNKPSKNKFGTSEGKISSSAKPKAKIGALHIENYHEAPRSSAKATAEAVLFLAKARG